MGKHQERPATICTLEDIKSSQNQNCKHRTPINVQLTKPHNDIAREVPIRELYSNGYTTSSHNLYNKTISNRRSIRITNRVLPSSRSLPNRTMAQREISTC